MVNTKSLKILVGLVIVLLFCLIVAGWFWALDSSPRPASNSDVELVGQVTDKKNLGADVISNKFPTNLPVEDGVDVTENSEIVLEDGRTQATLTFESSLSLQANYDRYLTFLRNNDWEIKGQTDQEVYKSVMGQKGFQQLQATINRNELSETNTVLLTITDI